MKSLPVPAKQKGDASHPGGGLGWTAGPIVLGKWSSVPPGVGRHRNDLPPAPLKPFGMTGHHPDPVVQRCRGHRKVRPPQGVGRDL